MNKIIKKLKIEERLNGTKRGRVLLYLFDYRQRRLKEIAFEDRWAKCLMRIRGKAHYNEENESYVIKNVKVEEIGMSGEIEIPLGLDTSYFINNIRGAIEDSMGCLLVLKHNREKKVLEAVIVLKCNHNFPFKPVKCESECILVGYDHTRKPCVIDLTQAAPHLLVTGASGTGKSFICFMIVSNLIWNYKEEENEFEIILLQIMKAELSIFKDCKPCKNFGMYTELNLVAEKLERLEILAKQRADILGGGNVRTFNKNNKGNKFYDEQIKPIYILVDELAFFMPTPSDDNDVKSLKKRCIQAMVRLGQAGRSSAIHIIALVQRGTKANIDANMKSNFVRLTARQNSIIDSQVILDSGEATKLLDREVILKAGGELKMLYIPTISQNLSEFKALIPELRTPEPASNDELEDILKKYGSFSYFNSIDGKILKADADNTNDSVLADAFEKAVNEKGTNIDIDCDNVTQSNTINQIPEASTVKAKQDKLLVNIKDLKHKGKNDSFITELIDKYSVIPSDLANALLGKERSPQKRVVALKDAGVLDEGLVHELYTGKNEKDIYRNKSEKYYFLAGNKVDTSRAFHCYMIGKAITHFYKNGYKIHKASNQERLYYDTVNSKYIIPDADILVSKNDKWYHFYVEIDYTHATNQEKFKKYEKLSNQDFCLFVVIRDDEEVPVTNQFPVFRENFMFQRKALSTLD